MKGREFNIRCFECDKGAPQDADACHSCGGTLVLEMQPVDCVSAADLAQTWPSGGSSGIWSYTHVLPRTKHRISLGEGLTPLVECAWPSLGDAKIWLKMESVNPTLSFKDRGMALASSVARDRGMERLIVASTGNSAVSASAYAAAAELQCTVLVGAESNAGTKLAACKAYGADVEEVPGDYSDAYARSRELAQHGAFNVSTTYQNPVLTEAYRTIALELVSQLGRAPGLVVVPIGAGPLLRGLGLGFTELRECGVISTAPQLIGVQAAACAPLERAWRTDHWAPALRAGVETFPTAATAIADPMRGYERQGLLTLDAVARSTGAIVAVGEEQIHHAEHRLLAGGQWVEPSSATALAALDLPELEERIAATDDVVLMMTGHGIKTEMSQG